MELKFETKDILNKLKTNREDHIKIVQEAQKGYREKFRELLTTALEHLDAGKAIEPRIVLAVPESHVDDFDRAIEMFEMTTDKEITLSEIDFQSYVRNRWQWQGRFLASNSMYSATAASLMGEVEV